MTAAASAGDLERRKSLRIRLRRDLDIEAHRYEGKTFFVVKDPVSLRYYRLKDNEHFLLQFLDGKHTLEEAQKAYEKEYRPERLRLEDLEGFAQQLLTAGLALSDSPKAGKQLFERRGKRRRREWMQTITNILYIKIPVFDPEKILKFMLLFLGWIFSTWFFVLSVVLMLAAVLLVATHFDTFLSKLPSYHEFFSFKTAIYLWMALAVVKVIHEFGHGLSCKRFGGEVHEMGFLLMCLSPALYCNVSDAWILPNKWHRIIISAAGIYVELVIAAIATFIWWYTPTQPFINNLALSLMIVCSVSTVVFNANPLMRFDGYYVLADWLEIPNLREKANRYLKNMVLERCLGVEVPPEEYMELWRKVLFLSFAIISYLYRWMVTFSILYLFYTFLRPYKLEVIGNALTLAALLSMTVWPFFNLFKNIHRRGRMPDMKQARVIVSSLMLLSVLGVLAFLPLPISRIRGLALVQADPENSSQITLKRSAILDQLRVTPGEKVQKGQTLAVFRDPDLEEKLSQAHAEYENAREYLKRLEQQKSDSLDPRERRQIDDEIVRTVGKRETAEVAIQAFKRVREEELVILAPREGVIGHCPRLEDIGRLFEGARDQPQSQPHFSIHEPGKVRLCMPLSTSDYNRLARDHKALIDRNSRTGESEQHWINLRVHGLDSSTWRGVLDRLEESEAKYIPVALSTRANGPVAVHPPNPRLPGLVPQTQHYLIYINIINPDPEIHVGAMSQVKIYLQPETCLHWAWRTINDVFNLRLM
ncbi:MAG: site-2 protease family protein [Gemmataceae bacterium]